MNCRVRDRDIACDEYRWDEFDARGIFLARVCEHCRDEKLRGYRAEVLTNPRYEASEQIEPDEEVYRFDDTTP